MLFASPDFGASAAVDLFLLIFWPAMAAAVIFGILKGAQLCVSDKRRMRRGVAIIVASLALPIASYFAPRVFMRIACGNFPVGEELEERVNSGMSMAEVQAVLGPPHDRVVYRDGSEWDTYWMDALCRRFFVVRYDRNHRVYDVP